MRLKNKFDGVYVDLTPTFLNPSALEAGIGCNPSFPPARDHSLKFGLSTWSPLDHPRGRSKITP